MNQLPDDIEILKEKEMKLRKQLFLAREKPQISKEEYERNTLIRQAQKWKLEAILQKKRALGFSQLASDTYAKLFDEKHKRKHAEAANSLYKSRIQDIRKLQHKNMRIIQQARYWKKEKTLAEIKRFHEENTPQVVREKERMAEEIEDLETKLKAAQRKLSLVRSNNQRLLNVEEELAERRIRMRMMTETIRFSKTNTRLDNITVKEVLLSSQKTYTKYREAADECEKQRVAIKKLIEETRKLKTNLIIMLKKGIVQKIKLEEKENREKTLMKENSEIKETLESLENKIKENEEDLRYVEYLHDQIYEKIAPPKLLEKSSHSTSPIQSTQPIPTASSTSSANLNY